MMSLGHLRRQDCLEKASSLTTHDWLRIWGQIVLRFVNKSLSKNRTAWTRFRSKETVTRALQVFDLMTQSCVLVFIPAMQERETRLCVITKSDSRKELDKPNKNYERLPLTASSSTKRTSFRTRSRRGFFCRDFDFSGRCVSCNMESVSLMLSRKCFLLFQLQMRSQRVKKNDMAHKSKRECT